MPEKTVIFHDPNAGERGSSVAIYHYADYNEKILGNRSVIAILAGSDDMAARRYRSRFRDTVVYDTPSDLSALSRHGDFF